MRVTDLEIFLQLFSPQRRLLSEHQSGSVLGGESANRKRARAQVHDKIKHCDVKSNHLAVPQHARSPGDPSHRIRVPSESRSATPKRAVQRTVQRRLVFFKNIRPVFFCKKPSLIS